MELSGSGRVQPEPRRTLAQTMTLTLITLNNRHSHISIVLQITVQDCSSTLQNRKHNNKIYLYDFCKCTSLEFVCRNIIICSYSIKFRLCIVKILILLNEYEFCINKMWAKCLKVISLNRIQITWKAQLLYF